MQTPNQLIKDGVTQPILVNRPYLPSLETYVEKLKGVWDRNYITNDGPLVRELEEAIRKFHSLSFKVRCVANGGLGLQLIIKALGIKGEVITTPFTYIATSSCLKWEGCQPVFADIESDSLTIDPRAVESAITSRTEAILATHVYGNPCDVEALAEIGRKHGIPVIYDAAHAFGVTYKGESLLEWGDASMVSMHATKIFHSVEGGFVVSRNVEVERKLDWMRRFGHDGLEAFHGVGINAKLSELHAAMGLCMLEEYHRIAFRREEISRRYDEGLVGTDVGYARVVWREGASPNFSFYPLLFDNEQRLVAAQEKLKALGILTRRYFYPSLDTLDFLDENGVECSVAQSVSKRVLCLPLNFDISDQEIDSIIELLA